MFVLYHLLTNTYYIEPMEFVSIRFPDIKIDSYLFDFRKDRNLAKYFISYENAKRELESMITNLNNYPDSLLCIYASKTEWPVYPKAVCINEFEILEVPND